MNFLRRNLPILGRVFGGVVLFSMLSFAIWKYPGEGNLWFAWIISILMILSGWMLPSSGSRQKEKGGESDSGIST